MNSLVLLFYALFGTCYIATYCSFIISFIVIIILNINNISCNDAGMPLQYFDIMMLLEQAIFLIAISFLLCITYKMKNIKYHTTCLIATCFQLFVLFCLNVIGGMYLYSFYNTCFSDIKLLWIFTLLYLIINLVDGFFWIILMILNRRTFYKNTNEYIVIDGSKYNSYESDEIYSSINSSYF